jgi:hypothetical protein
MPGEALGYAPGRGRLAPGPHECRTGDHETEGDDPPEDGRCADPDRVAEDEDAPMIAARLASEIVASLVAVVARIQSIAHGRLRPAARSVCIWVCSAL